MNGMDFVAATVPPLDGLVAGVRAGDTRAVARAITLVEDGLPEARALLAALFPTREARSSWG